MRPLLAGVAGGRSGRKSEDGVKIFWALIGVLVLVTCGLFVFADAGDRAAVESGDEIGAAIGEVDAEPVSSDGGAEEAVDSIERAVADAADEPAPVSMADPVIRETESVEEGLAEMGVVVVEETDTPQLGDSDEIADAEAPAADARDGEQVVLDAIVAQQVDGSSEVAPVDSDLVESAWIVSESSDEGDVAAIDPVAEAEPAAGDAEGEDTETEVAGDAPAPAAETDGASAVSDAGTEGSTPPAVEGVGVGALDAIDAAVKQGAAKAPPGPEGTVVVREDGSLLINDSIVVAGKGTEESPYEVSWDLLVTSSRTFAPEKGKKLLPAWAGALDGKWIRVRGYLLLPVMASDSKELLVMLNQWDGCCIGVPPSPYDAAEVRLERSVDESVGGAGFVSYGTIKGKLDIDPYITGGWLLGLYVIEQGELELGSGRKGT